MIDKDKMSDDSNIDNGAREQITAILELLDGVQGQIRNISIQNLMFAILLLGMTVNQGCEMYQRYTMDEAIIDSIKGTEDTETLEYWLESEDEYVI
jgi:hypothetical protein